MNQKRSRDDRTNPVAPDGGQPPVGGPVRKNPIQSVLTSLPALMLMIGVAYYFYNENKQSGGDLLMAKMQQFEGRYVGVAEQGKRVNAQRILWIELEAKKQRGLRVNYRQAQALAAVPKETQVEVWAAPRVSGSDTLWVVKLTSGDQVVTDLSPALTNTKTTDTQ